MSQEDGNEPASRRSSRLQFSIRSLFLLTVVVAAYFAGWATARHEMQNAQRRAEAADRALASVVGEDLSEACKAKEAIIEMARTNGIEFWDFDAAKMSKLDVKKVSEGQYYFGPFHMDLTTLTYQAALGPADELYVYDGTLEYKDGLWKALPPKLTRRHNLRWVPNTGTPKYERLEDEPEEKKRMI